MRTSKLTTHTLWILLLLFVSGNAIAALSWNNVQQEFTILPDGTTQVVDTRTLRATGEDDFGEAFICVLHPPTMTITMDTNASGAISSGPSSSAYQQACSGGTELVVRNSSRVTERRVSFVYEISNIPSYYSDVVEWYWQVLELDRPNISGYELTVRFPAPLQEPFDAFVHRYNLQQDAVQTSLSQDNTELHVAISRVGAGDGLDIRAFIPPESFDVRGTTAGFAQLLEDEATFAQLNVPGSPSLRLTGGASNARVGSTFTVSGNVRPEGGRTIETVQMRVGQGDITPCNFGSSGAFECVAHVDLEGTFPVIVSAIDNEGYRATANTSVEGLGFIAFLRHSPILAGLLSLGLVFTLYFRIIRKYMQTGREPKPLTMKYQFEPPSDLASAFALAIQFQSATSTNLKEALYATILDLTRRGHITLSQEGRSKTSLTLHEDPNDTMQQFERELFDFLVPAADVNGLISSGSLKKYMTTHGAKFLTAWSASIGIGLAEKRGGPLTTEESRAATRKATTTGVITVVIAGIGIFLFQEVAMGIMIGAAILCFLGIIISSIALPAFRPEIAEERAQWLSFKRTLRDYTIMKDAPADFFKLWDEYFIYAAAFGVAKQYLRNIERAAPLHGIDDRTMIASAYWLSRGGTMNFTDLSSLANSVTTMSQSLSASTASASSGGSVGGGGGASGGGGSSGGR